MSTLTVNQMLQEAIGPINERLRFISRKDTAKTEEEKYITANLSFSFVASDGNQLSVKFFQRLGSKEVAGLATLTGQQLHTVITKAGHLTNYPFLTTNCGDLVFVHDPSAVCADRVFQGYKMYEDPQEWWRGSARQLKTKVVEHVPRPMNAYVTACYLNLSQVLALTEMSRFIIYRNSQMATVRQQNPGIGNNDVCMYPLQLQKMATHNISHCRQLIVTMVAF